MTQYNLGVPTVLRVVYFVTYYLHYPEPTKARLILLMCVCVCVYVIFLIFLQYRIEFDFCVCLLVCLFGWLVVCCTTGQSSQGDIRNSCCAYIKYINLVKLFRRIQCKQHRWNSHAFAWSLIMTPMARDLTYSYELYLYLCSHNMIIE